MKLIDLLKLLPKVLPILSLPDWLDSGATRLWVVKVLDFADWLAEQTGTTFDDQAVDYLNGVVNNDSQWAALYGLIIDLVDGNPDVAPLPDNPRVMAVADEAKIDPVTIIAIVELVLRVVEWWRNRKG